MMMSMKNVFRLSILILSLSCLAEANIAFKNTTEVISDPYNKRVNPKRIPGAIIRHYFHIYNNNDKALDKSTLTAKIDMKKFDVRRKSISVDKKGLIQNFKIMTEEGKVLLYLGSLAVQQKVVLYFDVMMH